MTTADRQVDIQVRAVVARDTDDILRIERESFPDPWTDVDVRRALTGAQAGGIAATVAGDELAGYCFYWVVADEAEIHSLGVARHKRRRGVARAMLERLFAECGTRGVRRVLLEVRYTNTAAIALYHGLGFSVDTVRPRYYPDGEDAVLMSRRLAGSGGAGSE
jgi:ribosomal-protein-alanine N-acetyltransferase